MLLEGVTGQVGPGLTAIMGASGAGKSSLLNALACRLDPGVGVTAGDMLINGAPYSLTDLKRMAG